MKTIEKLNALSEEMLQNIRGGVAGSNDNIMLYSSDNNNKKECTCNGPGTNNNDAAKCQCSDASQCSADLVPRREIFIP